MATAGSEARDQKREKETVTVDECRSNKPMEVVVRARCNFHGQTPGLKVKVDPILEQRWIGSAIRCELKAVRKLKL